MSDQQVLDKRQLRRSFEKAAATYDASAVLQHEVGRRMLSRLDYIRHEPASILDAGSGTGDALAALQARHPRAVLLALDIALAMVRRAHRRAPWWRRMLGRGVVPVCADLEQLPLSEGAVGMVWSNLALQWTNEPQRAFP